MMSTNLYAQELQNTNKYDVMRSANENEISGSVAVDKESLRRLEQLIKTLIRTYMKLFMIDSQRTVETTLLSAANFNNNSNNENGEILSQYQLGVPNDNKDVNTAANGSGRKPITRSTPSSSNSNQKQDYVAQPTSGSMFSGLNPQQMAGRLESILPFGLGTSNSAGGTISRQSPQTGGQFQSYLPFGYFGLNGSGSNGESSQGRNTQSGQGKAFDEFFILT